MLSKDVAELKDYIVGLRRYFHEFPEVSKEEYKTAEKIEEELDKLGISHYRVSDTGVVGVLPYEGKEKKAIVLRADIDALRIQEANEVPYKSRNNGVMHACGHDGHIAMLLGAAKQLLEHKAELKQPVYLIFQPAEETGSGARLFLENKVIKEAGCIIGLHLASFIPKGKVMVQEKESNASCDYFKITVTGRSCHVSKPHEGIDALYTASQIVTSIQAIAARLINPLEPVVIGIGKMTAGTSYNIVANEAVLEGTTRAFNKETRQHINDKVKEIARSVAETYGAKAEVEFKDYASPLVNDSEVADEIINVARNVAGSENVIVNGEKNMMADDFAEYLNHVKGCYFFVGSASDESTSYPHHHEKFDIDEEALLTGTNIFTGYVLEKSKQERV